MNKLENQSGFLTRYMILMFSVLAVGCGGQDPIFGEGGKLASLAPTVTTVTPLATNPIATDVAINSKITATFSKDVALASINNTSFSIACPTNPAVAGTVSYVAASRVATFSPTNTLPPNSTCSVTLTTAIKDLTGLHLATPFVWSFDTGAAPDIIRPTITLTTPIADAVNIAYNQKVSATFSEDMDATSINSNTVLLQGPGASPVKGTVIYAAGARSVIFSPTLPATLAANTLYTATVTTGVKDLAGNTLANNTVWTFTTSVAPDTTRPTVSLKTPDAGDTNVAINSKVLVTFSESMDPATITTANVLVKAGATDITGTVTYAIAAKTATFIPAAPLPPSTLLSVTVNTAATDLAGNALAGNIALLPAASDAMWTFTTGLTPDTTKPSVTLKVPAAGSTGVSVNSMITASFSEDMDPLFMRESSFTLTSAGGSVISMVSYAVGAKTAILIPNTPLAFNTVYTATLTTSARDLAGNSLAGNSATPTVAANAVWTFTTGLTPDMTPPTVTNKVPAANAINVALNTKVTVKFSEQMDPLTINDNSVLLQGPGANAITGEVKYDPATKTAIFKPAINLAANTLFTATVTTAAKDSTGNALLNNVVWTFTTGAAPDLTPPTVLNVNPLNLATGVCLQKTINATFSESIDPLTLSTSTVTLKETGGALTNGMVDYDELSKIATFSPTNDLLANTNYTATITTAVKDLANNALASNKVWTFTTGSQTCAQAVNLGAAAPFGNLGGTAGTTNQGILTVINGDLASSAVSASAVTGFHDTANDIYTETDSNKGFVNGKIYTCTVSTTGPTAAAINPTSCSIAAKANKDAKIAFDKTSPASMPGGTDPGAGQLGGLTLAPGIYQAASDTFKITGSDLTLDGQGDDNAIWVFQTEKSLTVGDTVARSVKLQNGAQAKNVFWHVGSAATINGAGGGTMIGTILASEAVSFSTAGNVALVTLNGRAVGLNASVTMVNTVINVPAP